MTAAVKQVVDYYRVNTGKVSNYEVMSGKLQTTLITYFQDEFEVENQMYGDKWGSQQRYKDWQNNMKVAA